MVKMLYRSQDIRSKLTRIVLLHVGLVEGLAVAVNSALQAGNFLVAI